MIIELLATHPRAALEPAIEQRAKIIPCLRGVVLARVLGELSLYLSMVDVTVAPSLAMNGYWEFWVTQAIARHVKPGMRCADVGANVGYYTMLMAALVGGEGHVTAFDLFPDLVQLVRQSAEINGFRERVTARFGAVGVTAGDPVRTRVPRAPQGMLAFGHLGNAAILNEDSRLPEGDCWVEWKVPGLSLDTEFPDGPLDFIKIDVEGAEPLVWEGSSAVRARCNPVICMEYEAWRPGYPEFLDRVRAEGYWVRFVDYTGELGELPAVIDPERLYMLWLTR